MTMPNIPDEILDYLRSNPKGIYVDEDLTEYSFVDGSLSIKPINHFNTNKNLMEWQHKIIKHKHNYDVLKSLEDCWNELKINKEYYSRENIQHNSPVEALNNAIDYGVYPPPEVLLAINECFSTYFELCGEAELEDIFFGKRKKRTGNKSAQKYSKQLYTDFRGCVAFDFLETSIKRPLEDIATEFLTKKGLNTDVDSFLRQYRRYKKSKKAHASDK